MSAGEALFGCVFVLVQVLGVVFCFRRQGCGLIRTDLLRRGLVYLVFQMMFVIILLMGGYFESHMGMYEYIRRLASWDGPSVRLAFSASGDPGLKRFVEDQRPELPRPDLGDAESLQSWQQALRRTLRNDLFELAKKEEPVVVQFERVDTTRVETHVVRTFISFESFDGTSIPGFLFVPDGSKSRPAIIVLHGHVRENEAGISQTGGLIASYQHKAALVLAKAGYVTLAIGFRGFRPLGLPDYPEHRFVAYNALLGGSFYKAIVSKDIKYAFDLLQRLQEVDPTRIGITGVSYGGEMAAKSLAVTDLRKQAKGG